MKSVMSTLHIQAPKENRNKLLKNRKKNAITLATFAYDALGRRIEKVDAIESTTTRYYYDDQRVAVQTLVSGGVETDDRYFVFGNTIDEVLLMHVIPAQAGIQDLYYAHDHLYSPVALFAANGTVAERYEYDAYGSVQFLTSNFNPLTSSQYANPYTFTGRELDALDNNTLHLMYYRARTYDPQTGRFMQRDPLGINPAEGEFNAFDVLRQYSDGMNIYEYGRSFPIFFIDPYGLKCWTRTSGPFLELFGDVKREYTQWYGIYSPVPGTSLLYKRGWRDVQPARQYIREVTICITICPPWYHRSVTKNYTGEIVMIILDWGWEFKWSLKDPNTGDRPNIGDPIWL